MSKTFEKMMLGILIVVFIVGANILVYAAIDQKDVSAQTQVQTVSQKSSESTTPGTMLTQTQALEIAQGVYPGTATEIEFETVNDREVYEVSFEDSDVEVEIVVDAYTGDVLVVDQEKELSAAEISSLNPKISENQARSIARSQVSGTVSDVEASWINGVYVYEIEVTQGAYEYDVLVDMMTGAVVGIEKEVSDGDDDDDERKSDSSKVAKTSSSSQRKVSSTSTTSLESASKPVTENEAVDIALARAGSGSFDEIERDTYNGKSVYVVDIEGRGEEWEITIDIETGRVLDVNHEDD